MTDPEKVYDVAIVGGGPAGMAASMWCAELGLDSIIFEREEQLGGQLHKIYNPILNYPGLSVSNGNELFSRFCDHLRVAPERMMIGEAAEAVTIDPMGVRLESGRLVAARAVVIATGVRRRKLGIAGEEDFRGRGILDSGSREGSSVSGKRVAIIGGGDAALENAMILGKEAERVLLVHRRGEFSARPAFVNKVRLLSNVEFYFDSVVTAIAGGNEVEAISIKHTESGEVISVPVDHVLIRIGVEPNSEIVKEMIDLDPLGYIPINSYCETSVEGLFAIGDVADPKAPTISGAIGQAATGIKVIATK